MWQKISDHLPQFNTDTQDFIERLQIWQYILTFFLSQHVMERFTPPNQRESDGEQEGGQARLPYRGLFLFCIIHYRPAFGWDAVTACIRNGRVLIECTGSGYILQPIGRLTVGIRSISLQGEIEALQLLFL